MYIIITFALILFLEFVIEPIFKIRKRTLHKFGSIPTVIVLFIVTFLIRYFLTSQFPNIDDRIFTFSCIGIMLHFMPRKYEQYKKIKAN